MKIQFLQNTIELGKKTPTIFRQGEVAELDDKIAQQHIDNEQAIEWETPKAPKGKEKSETPDETWTNPDLLKYAEDKKIDLKGATIKKDIIAAIQAAEAATA